MLAKLFNEKCYTLVFFDYKIICGCNLGMFTKQLSAYANLNPPTSYLPPPASLAR